jgi:hypothetical protein
MLSQGLKPDIYDQYLVGAGNGDWTTWNSPSGAYVGVVASSAQQVGAIPMYTLYQMATNGDGNLADLNDSTFMTRYWSNIKLLYQQIAAYGKPAIVNLEPDFWGYAEQQSNQNPTTLTTLVTINPDCASLSNDIVGLAGCLVKMARQYAPKAYVGFPISDWGGNGTAQVVTFMSTVGAQKADFIVVMTLDRDAGCFEVTPLPSECARGGTGYYWDETNQTSPTFSEHLAKVQQYHSGLGNLPVIWWQTPMGLPSSTPGGTPNHYRDNREDYFLKHPSELTAVPGTERRVFERPGAPSLAPAGELVVEGIYGGAHLRAVVPGYLTISRCFGQRLRECLVAKDLSYGIRESLRVTGGNQDSGASGENLSYSVDVGGDDGAGR